MVYTSTQISVAHPDDLHACLHRFMAALILITKKEAKLQRACSSVCEHPDLATIRLILLQPTTCSHPKIQRSLASSSSSYLECSTSTTQLSLGPSLGSPHSCRLLVLNLKGQTKQTGYYLDHQPQVDWCGLCSTIYSLVIPRAVSSNSQCSIVILSTSVARFVPYLH
jgi:hypothetical protein